jgi:DNA-binding Xre family transcriptional regulator
MKPKNQKMYNEYFNSLNTLVDHLFDLATKQKWSWEKLADEAGIGKQTIANLGDRKTRFPQYRTVECIAIAMGGRIDFVRGRYQHRKANLKLRKHKLPSEPRRKKLKIA